MSHIHLAFSSTGHSDESFEMGDYIQMSSYSGPIDPDMVAPAQQNITIMDNKSHHTVDIDMKKGGACAITQSNKNTPFLFSTISLHSMTLNFPCNIFANLIYHIFEHKNEERPETLASKEEMIHGQPFPSRNSVSTLDFTNELPTVICNKGDQTVITRNSNQIN